MFDTRLVGKKIMSLRKDQNLTQMDLADALGVSFQAVSNWERGNSMPDISKLPELAEVLKTSVDQLLGASKETKVIKEIIQEVQPVVNDLEELKSVAPLLKPKSLDAMLENLRIVTQPKISDLVEIAPFLSNDYLSRLVDELDAEGNFDALVDLAPFLSGESLEAIGKDLIGAEDFERLSEIAPFMTTRHLDEVVMKRMDKLHALVDLYPFLSSEVTETIAQKFIDNEDYEALEEIAPFLGRSYVDGLTAKNGAPMPALLPFTSSVQLGATAQAALDRGDLEQVDACAPFLNSGVLDDMLLAHMAKHPNVDFERFYPFLKSETLNAIADKILESKGIKGLSGIAPFL